MNQSLHSFLDQHFEGLVLAPPLFYSHKKSIRFEISNPAVSFEGPEFMRQAFHRAITLFHEVFTDTDDIFLITDVHTEANNTFLHRKPLNVYRKYIKKKEMLYKLKMDTLFHKEHIDEESGKADEMVTYRFRLGCQKNDICYSRLIQAICYEDLGHPSKILKNNSESGCEVYLINLTKKMIYHLYDDRGCDVLAADTEDIRFLYDRYNEWILDYDREEIDAVFRK